MSLTRRQAIAAFAGSALIAPRAFAQARMSYEVAPKPVADGIWMIEGATEYFDMENGGAIVNCVLLQGDSGLIAIDTGPSRRFGEALATAAKGLDPRGIKTVINTHHHPDHFFGNQVFADGPIFALPETQVEAFEHGDALSDNMYRLLGDWMRGTEVVPPKDVVTGGEVTFDGRRMLAMPLKGHTAGDLAVLDAETGVLVAGDLAFLDRAPTTPNADIADWLASLDALEAASSRAIIPGHGPFDTQGASLTQTRAYLTWLSDTLRDAAAQGFDMVEIMQTPLPEAFASMGAQPAEFTRSVTHLYPTIEREVMPRAN